MPKELECRAFCDLATLLRPSLRHAMWPSPQDFPHVPRSWSDLRGHNGWFRQYQTLARRIRTAAREPRSDRWGWWRVRYWVVEPVIRCPMEVALGQLLRWRFRLSAGARGFVCAIIYSFLWGYGVSARPSFRVRPDALASPGNGKILLKSAGPCDGVLVPRRCWQRGQFGSNCDPQRDACDSIYAKAGGIIKDL